MGFWTLLVIAVLVVSWIGRICGDTKKKTKAHLELPTGPRRPQPVEHKPLLASRAEAERSPFASLTGVCQEINRLTISITESIAQHLQVEEATKQLQHEMMVERHLIDGAMETAELLLKTDKEREAMTTAHRALFDTAKLKYEKIHKDLKDKDISSSEAVLVYRRPEFSITNFGSDDAINSAIRDKSSALKQQRDDYIGAANRKLRDPRLAAYFVEIFEQRGGPETAKSLKKAAPSIVFVHTKRENAAIKNTELINALATPSTEEAKNNTDCISRPALRQTVSNFALSETMANIAGADPHMRIAIMDRLKTIDPPYLLHFTQVENIPSIIRHGLCPVSIMTKMATQFRANDRLRLDGHMDAVSLSIAHPNERMFSKYRWQNLQQKWAVLVLEPSILWLLPTAFNRHNAADKRMSRLSREERMSVEALDGMFHTTDDLPSRQANRLLQFDPTDVQAELLVFSVIKPVFVTGVVFCDCESFNAYAAGLGTWRLSIHSKESGFFGARAYARKTGWTY